MSSPSGTSGAWTRAGDVVGGSRAASLIFLNGGLGNGVIIGPALRQLQSAYPTLRCYTPPNPILESDWFREALQLRGMLPILPPLWRRFLPADGEAMLDFAWSAGVVQRARPQAQRHDRESQPCAQDQDLPGPPSN